MEERKGLKELGDALMVASARVLGQDFALVEIYD